MIRSQVGDIQVHSTYPCNAQVHHCNTKAMSSA
jgi:hypothetical protein